MPPHPYEGVGEEAKAIDDRYTNIQNRYTWSLFLANLEQNDNKDLRDKAIESMSASAMRLYLRRTLAALNGSKGLQDLFSRAIDESVDREKGLREEISEFDKIVLHKHVYRIKDLQQKLLDAKL